MLDMKYVKDHKEEIKKAIKDKRVDLDLDQLLNLDDERLKLLRETERLSAEKNKLNDLIRKAKTAEEKKEIVEKGKEFKKKLDELDPEYKKIQQEFDVLIIKVPTIYSPDTPVGKSEEENKEIYKWGDKPKFDFKPKDHIEIGKNLDLLDLERGKKVAGYRGYYLKNEGALLVMGLMMYALKKMAQKGYTPMIPPTLVKGFALFGSGYFKGL